MNHQDVMLDLETLGKKAGCPVLSIGAVSFGRDGLGKEFYIPIVTETQTWLHPDPDTVAWWSRQSPEARKVFTDRRRIELADALEGFTAYCESIASIKYLRVWGNGADFDQPILRAAYDHPGVTAKVPWQWGSRCYRTLKNQYKGVPMERKGTYHNALDDAKSQAEHAVAILNKYSLWES